MRNGPRCPVCRISMVHVVQRDADNVITDECFECPECGYSEEIERVSDTLTVRKPEPFDAKVFFERLRKAVQ